MSDWTAGYVADIGYTFGYYTELNPLRIRLAFLKAGLVCPEIGSACELGFGQGISTNLHASATMTDWHGTDFNPSQAAFARELADVSGASAHLYDESFDEFCSRTDLPEFDYIGLHGIWSWISDENRAVIVDFIRRKLKVGGILYVSYNTQPGWASFAPMRHLLTQHAEVNGVEGLGIVNRIDGALDFAEKLLATNPIYSRVNPQVVERLKKIKGQNRHYLAHEYFNKDWHPMHFSSMMNWLEPAKVEFACSANYIDQVDSVNLTAEQRVFLQEIPDPMFRETARDFMVNQQFRKDYWVKGVRRLSALEQVEQMRQQRILLVVPQARISLKASGALGEGDMSEHIYNPILAVLADYRTKTIAQIEQALTGKGIDFAHLLQAVMVLSHNGTIVSPQDEKLISKARQKTDKLNMHLMSKARGSADITYLASPVTGGGVAVDRFDQLFLLARAMGRKTTQEWGQFVFHVLAAQGQTIKKAGQEVVSPEEQLQVLAAQAQEFSELRLPIMKILGIAS